MFVIIIKWRKDASINKNKTLKNKLKVLLGSLRQLKIKTS